MREPTGLRPMSDAPLTASWVALWYRDKHGNVYPIAAHWADGGGEDQPRFRGWFKWSGYDGGGHVEVSPDAIGWTVIEGAEMRT